MSAKAPLLLPVEDVATAAPPAPDAHLYERQMQSTSRVIGIVRWGVVALALVCGAMLVVVFAVNTHVPNEHRLMLGTVVGAVMFSMVGLLLFMRRDPNTSIVLSVLTALMGGFCLGLSMWYA